MGILDGVEPNPDFANDTELSATLLNTLLSNVERADLASRYGRIAFCSLYGEPPENASTNPSYILGGSFDYVAGATTLTVVTQTTGQQSGDQLRIIRGGTAAAGYLDGAISDFTLANGAQTHTITINTSGYVADQVVEVRCYLRNAGVVGDYDWGNVEIRDMYISPISLAGYPGVPTFTATTDLTEAKLDQVANACTWLIRFIGMRVEPLFQAPIRREGPHTGQVTVKWTGSLPKTAGHPFIKSLIQVQQKTAGTVETIRMRVNGSIVATQALPTSPAEAGYILTYDASAVANGTRLWIEIDVVKTSPTEDTPGPLGKPDTSRISFFRVWSEAAAGAATFEEPLGLRSNRAFGPHTSPLTLLDWLTDLCARITDIKNRLDANPEIWARQPLYRMRYAFDSDQWKWFEPWAVASTLQRVGMGLKLRGKGLSVGYGPGTFKEEFNDVGAQTFENFRTETAIDADQVETQRVFLDNLPGLPPGAAFNVRGIDLFYAGEEFLVEEA